MICNLIAVPTKLMVEFIIQVGRADMLEAGLVGSVLMIIIQEAILE